MIERKLSELKRSLKNVVAVGSVHMVDDDQQAQASFLTNETNDKTPIMQQYGFASRPPKGSLCVGVCSGNREEIILLGTKSKAGTPKIDPGDTVVFTDDEESILLSKGKGIRISSPSLLIKNSSSQDDLISLLVDLVSAIEKSVTPTMIGPQPLSSKSELMLLKEKIRGFLVDA